MKKIDSVNNSKVVLGLLSGLKSRITSIKPLLTMLALLMVALFGVNEEAWGQLPYNTTMTQTHYNDSKVKVGSDGESYSMNAWSGGIFLQAGTRKNLWGTIKGEEWTCPHCGKPTEVYSRVTGYYRAVQNFNDGKAHEFRDRKEYKFDSNTLNTPTESECESCKTDFTELPTTDFEKESSVGDAVRSILADTRKPMLFTTATCPNCKMAKKFIADAKFDCDILLAEENQELVKLYEITSAPTLVVFDNGSPVKIQNVSNIRKFLDELK